MKLLIKITALCLIVVLFQACAKKPVPKQTNGGESSKYPVSSSSEMSSDETSSTETSAETSSEESSNPPMIGATENDTMNWSAHSSGGTASFMEADIKSGELRGYAKKAYDDILKNFWNSDEKRFKKDYHGYVNDSLAKQDAVWSFGMAVMGMDVFYDVTNDPLIKEKLAYQWGHTKNYFTDEQFVTPGMAPNFASDDTGWDAMVYLIFYRHTGDPYALDIVKRLLANAFTHYAVNGDINNGLWYTTNTDHAERYKYTSIYCAGILHAALDYYDITGDVSYYNNTKAVYEYLEKNFLRNGKKTYPTFTVDCNDLLYFCDFNINRPSRTEPNGPDGGTRPYDIQECGSVSFLGGNMAMAALHGRFYKYTGDEKYKKRALETVNAIGSSPYYTTSDSVLANDRDAWANCTFVRYYARYALTFPGVSKRDTGLIYNTAVSIAKNARTPAGYYGGSWSGPAEGEGSKWWVNGSKPEQIMTTANSALMIFGAAYLESLL